MKMVRGALVVVILAGCAGVVPPVSPLPTGQSVPTASPTHVAPAPTTVAYVTYEGGGLSFEYPAHWQVLGDQDICFHDYTMVAVGTGEWVSGCADRTPGGELIATDPGEVVIAVSYFYSGPVSSHEVPPFDAQQLETGLASERNDPLVTIFVPGHRALEAVITTGEPVADADRSAIDHMIESMDMSSERPEPIRNGGADMPVSDCVDDVLTGRLGSRGGGALGLSQEDAVWIELLWPSGWQGRIGGDRRVSVSDADGTPVAREWDEVSIGGRTTVDGLRVCPEAVDVIRAF